MKCSYAASRPCPFVLRQTDYPVSAGIGSRRSQRHLSVSADEVRAFDEVTRKGEIRTSTNKADRAYDCG